MYQVKKEYCLLFVCFLNDNKNIMFYTNPDSQVEKEKW